MKQHEKYLKVLKTFDDYVTIKEWATEFYKVDSSQSKDKDEVKIKIRNIEKSISALVSTGKWSNILLIDKGTKPRKVKYIMEDNQEDNSEKNIHLASSPKTIKTIIFKDLMKAIEYLPDDYDLPHRDEYSNFNNTKQFSGYKEYLAFEMAVRNKDVIDISQKLDYIEEIIENHKSLIPYKDWLLGIEYWEDIFDGNPPELTFKSELKKEYIFISKLPVTKFKEDIDFLTSEKKIINERSEAVVGLKIITDYLQDKLIKEYYIYKNGYYFIKDGGYFDPDEAIDLGST